LLHALLKRKWIILACTLLTVLISAFFLLNRDRVFESSAQYSTGFTIQQVSLVNEAFNPYETDTKFNNVLETFNSPKVIGMLSYHLMLHDFDNPDNPFRKLNDRKMKTGIYRSVTPDRARSILNNKVDSMELLTTFDPEEERILEYIDLYNYDFATLDRNLLIERIPRTDYLDISFKSENPYLSAYVVNKVGEEFLRFYNSLSSTLTTASVEKIKNIVEQKKKQVDTITENLTRLREKQGSADPEESNKNIMQTIGQLQSRLADEKSSSNRIYFALQAINDRLEKLGPASSTTVTVPNNAEIVRIRTKMRELAPNKDDPKVADQFRKLQDDLDKAESAANNSPANSNTEAERSKLLTDKASQEAEFSASGKNMEYLDSAIARANSSLRYGGSSDAKLEALKNEADIANREYSDIKSKYSQAEGFKQTPTINFRQTLVGQPAVDPVPSHFLLIVGIAGFSMLAFSSLIIILLELLDSSIKSPSRFSSTVGLDLLNPVNRIDTRKRNMQDLFNFSNEEKDKHPNETLFIRFLRKLRFDLEDSGKRVILVTSTKKTEGKTMLIEALSYSLSMTNKKVLIIDTNFSNNSLTRHFDVQGSLEDFAGESNGNGHGFKGGIHPTQIKLVDIIGCKGGDYTPDEILDQKKLLENIRELAQEYDYILLEGASLNDHSDTKELSRYADGILPVFAADTVINQLDKESIQFLTDCGPKLMGCVLNKVQNENIDL
jgi:succinoglycan biosynthesis transport protein ExoP